MSNAEETMQILQSSSQIESNGNQNKTLTSSLSSLSRLEMNYTTKDNNDNNADKLYYFLYLFKYKVIGNTIVFWFNSKGEPMCLIGPHWQIFCSCFPLANILLALFYYAFLSHFINVFWTFIYSLLIGVFELVFIMNFLINPGLITNKESNNQKGFHCEKCNAFNKDDTKVLHCPKCDVCIENPDHHCGIIGKCIGKKYIALFYALILDTTFIYAFIFWSVIYYYIYYIRK